MLPQAAVSRLQVPVNAAGEEENNIPTRVYSKQIAKRKKKKNTKRRTPKETQTPARAKPNINYRPVQSVGLATYAKKQ